MGIEKFVWVSKLNGSINSGPIRWKRPGTNISSKRKEWPKPMNYNHKGI